MIFFVVMVVVVMMVSLSSWRVKIILVLLDGFVNVPSFISWGSLRSTGVTYFLRFGKIWCESVHS